MRCENVIPMAIAAVLQLSQGLLAQPAVQTEGEARWQSHFPEHPELYVPEPVQNRQPGVGLMLNPEANVLVSYNTRTGQEVTWDVARRDSGPIEAWVEGGTGAAVEAPGEGRRLRDFTDLQRVSDPTAYPWCVNCKLFYTKAGSMRVASGVLIDPLHVLTAGHCVHEGNGGNWVTDMVVVPGYDNGSRPYGDAVGVVFYAWAGWRWFGNTDDDIAIIELDRPIGALTSWHGYGYNNDPSFYRNNVFHNAGYPADFPFDGQSMYYWSGTFDVMDYSDSLGIWTGNEVGITRSSYGGQSGSAAYLAESPKPRVYAVLSNEFMGVTYFPRITESKFGDVEGLVNSNTPSGMDLVPLNVKVSPAGIMPGGQALSMSYIVHNYSSASWSGTVNVSVYLSTNDNISTLDTLIDSHSFTWDFGPKSCVSVGVSAPPVIPINMPLGRYWVGVILDISDYDTNNNDSDGQDAASIMVGPDVVFEDTFSSSDLDLTKWTEIGGPATASDLGINEPTTPRSLLLEASIGGMGIVGISSFGWVTSKVMDLSRASSATLIYHHEKTGGGAPPDGDTYPSGLTVSYWNGSDWIPLDTRPSNYPDMIHYEEMTTSLPPEALHANFRFRISRPEVSMDFSRMAPPRSRFNCGDWFVDDVRIEAAY